MKIETLTQWQRACTLNRAGNAVLHGELTEDEYHLLLGLYALACGDTVLRGVSGRYLSHFLNGVRRCPAIDPHGFCEDVETALHSLVQKGWIAYFEGTADGDCIGLNSMLCGKCPTAYAIHEGEA
jgi:hypothetical protein